MTRMEYRPVMAKDTEIPIQWILMAGMMISIALVKASLFGAVNLVTVVA